MLTISDGLSELSNIFHNKRIISKIHFNIDAVCNEISELFLCSRFPGATSIKVSIKRGIKEAV